MSEYLREAEILDQLSETQRRDLARAKRVSRWVGLILPLVLTAVATIITAVWVPRMPDPMAIHWGPNFEPDGFGAPWSNVAMSLGLGLFITALYLLQALQSWDARRRGVAVWSAMFRFLPAVVLGTVAFIQVISVGSAWMQLDVTDARETGSTGWLLAVGVVIWVGVTVLAYVAQPRLRIDAPGSGPAAPLELAPSERAVWVGHVRPSRIFMWIITTTIAALAVTTVLVSSVNLEAGLITGACCVLMLVLLAATSSFRVRIDDAGLEARSIVGWPVFRLRAADVVSVSAAPIEPFAEYGGWGLRWAPDRFGLVMRAGEGIVATRANGRLFAVTVDDADSGAALLAAAARRAQEGTK